MHYNHGKFWLFLKPHEIASRDIKATTAGHSRQSVR
jgi:hypothetical protein